MHLKYRETSTPKQYHQFVEVMKIQNCNIFQSELKCYDNKMVSKYKHIKTIFEEHREQRKKNQRNQVILETGQSSGEKKTDQSSGEKKGPT